MVPDPHVPNASEVIEPSIVNTQMEIVARARWLWKMILLVYKLAFKN